MSPFNWLLYLDVADDLMSFGSEAQFRSAVSRAYYGVFGKIRSKLETQGIQFEWKNIHHQVIKWLRSQPQVSVIHIGVELDRLRRDRNRADYDGIHTFSRSRAEKSLLQARSIENNIPWIQQELFGWTA